MNNRRDFIKDIATITFGFSVAPSLLANTKPDKNPLRFGYIGSSRRAGYSLAALKNLGQESVAFCDVDDCDRVRESITKFSTSKTNANYNLYSDYRKFLEKMHKEIDAVIVSTPDVSHFGASMLALEYGLPVYTEKPLCHSISQIRMLMAKAKEKNIATQMGNQSHSTAGIQICKEWIDADIIGKVRKITIWTDRPFAGGTQILKKILPLSGLSKEKPLPPTLNWDAWHATAEYDNYREFLHPGSWRVWWKYGSGALGDIGCHMLDIPVYALGLSMPSKVTSRQFGGTALHCAQQEVVKYYFDKTNQGVPLEISWHSGMQPSKAYKDIPNYDVSMLPEIPYEMKKIGKGIDDISTNGMFIIGDKGTIYSPTMHLSGTPVLLPKEKFQDLKASNGFPTPKIRYENNSHHLNFIKAIRGEEIASSNFDYAGKLTEIVQLGNLSLKTNSEIVWDENTMTCKDNPAANLLVNESLRDGWY